MLELLVMRLCWLVMSVRYWWHGWCEDDLVPGVTVGGCWWAEVGWVWVVGLSSVGAVEGGLGVGGGVDVRAAETV